MAFAYYDRLTCAQQRIYRQSDAVTSIPLPGTASLRSIVDHLARALARGNRPEAQAAAGELVAAITAQLSVPPLNVEVLLARPARRWGELHGLYSPARKGRSAGVTLWMRTARQKRVVAFRTFLRTLLHELCHHLDYTHLGLPDSFHTEGFYKRESGLLRQLIGDRGPGTPEAQEVAELLLPMR